MFSQDVTIRPAVADDVPLLDEFIRQLAREEGLPTPSATVEDLDAALFGEDAVARALIAEVNGGPAGFALFYPKYATVTGRRGIHLEDVYIVPQHRGHSIGRRIMSALLELASPQGMVDWWVMHSNDSAIGFYQRLGARELDGIAVFRLDHPDADPTKRTSGLSSAEGQ